MRDETLVTCHPASKFDRCLNNNDDIVSMHRISAMVNERHGGGYATRHSNWRYVTGVFDEIMSRHGSLFETLANAISFGTRTGAMVGDLSASSLAMAGDTPKYLRI